ncbi:MAG TPA: GTP-binding protein [Dehalococcoidia bacterium]|nr:GTP-binding protein [Dehalococcoidia bacterium]
MIADIVFGFLGSGKTTVIANILREWGQDEKIVVLVNEFGEVGIDGELLASQGAETVEMPAGCICCTLQVDFRRQMLEISETINPQRVIIEPTGVAQITQIMYIVNAELFQDRIEEVHNILITDATNFMDFYKRNRHFVESQVGNAQVVLLNKCDRIKKIKAEVIKEAILAINPQVPVILTEFGAVDWEEYKSALSAAPYLSAAYEAETASPTEEVEEMGFIHIHEDEDTLGYESFGCTYELSFEQQELEKLFQDLLNSNLLGDEIVRAKGIFRVDNKWVVGQLASGEVSWQEVKSAQKSKISIIGRNLKKELIGTAVNRCLAGMSG